MFNTPESRNKNSFNLELQSLPAEETRIGVLSHVIGIHGEPINLVDAITSIDSAKKKVWLMGPPGVHKSTVKLQLGEALAPMPIKLITYDNILRMCETQNGDKNNLEWSEAEWKDFSDELSKATGENEVEVFSAIEEDSAIQIFEGFCIGDKDAINSGIPFLYKIAQRVLQQKNDKIDSLFIFFAPDYRSQQRSAEIRKRIALSEHKDVLSILGEYNIIPEGYEDLNEEKRGEKIKTMYDKAASPEEIMMIRKKMIESAEVWLQSRGEIKVEELITGPYKVKPDEKISEEDEKHLQEDKLVAAHLAWKIRYELGLKEDRAIIVFSPFTKKPVYAPIENGELPYAA